MKKGLSLLLVTVAISLTSSVFATDAVTESNLTSLKLPAGAIEVTDEKATTPFNELLEAVAKKMGGSCEYSEFLAWLDTDSKTLADKLAGPIVDAGYTVKDFDTGDTDNGTYEEFAMTSSKDNYAGVWVDSPDSVVLGWCNVK